MLWRGERLVFPFVNTVYAFVLHHPAQAALIAADADMDLFGVAGGDLVDPLRISHQLTAHGCTLDAAILQLLFHKLRMRKAAYAADRQRCILTHQVAEFQKAAFLRKIGVLCTGDRILQVRVVCQCHMEAGHTGFF